MSTHSFPLNIAIQYGVNEAIILQHIYFWYQKNKANKKHFYDGAYWSYNTAEAFSEIFPYFTQRQIQYAINKLREEGLVQTGNYNANKSNRTLWYTLTQKGLSYFETSILQNCQMQMTKLSNANDKNVKSYTDISTDINTVNKKAIASCGLSSQKNIDATQEKSNEVLEDVISLEEFRDLWLEIKGDVNLDKVEQKYERCVIFYNKKKSKTGIKNYAKEFISKEDERFSNNKDMPLKPPVSQKEAQQEVVEYKEPQVIEIPFKKEFAEVYEEVEKVVNSNFLFNHYISCAVADINDDKITIYNKGYLDKKAVEKAEQRASSMIKEKISKHLDRLKKEDALKNYGANMKFAKNDEKRGKALVSYFKELLKEPNIAIEFVYKKAIRVIND